MTYYPKAPNTLNPKPLNPKPQGLGPFWGRVSGLGARVWDLATRVQEPILHGGSGVVISALISRVTITNNQYLGTYNYP